MYRCGQLLIAYDGSVPQLYDGGVSSLTPFVGFVTDRYTFRRTCRLNIRDHMEQVESQSTQSYRHDSCDVRILSRMAMSNRLSERGTPCATRDTQPPNEELSS